VPEGAFHLDKPDIISETVPKSAIERSRWRGIEFVAGVGVPTTFLPSAGGASNE
jgi:hypothetical protein